MIKIQPGGILFAKDLARCTRNWINGQQQFFLLKSILDQEAKWSSRFFPDNASKVRVLLSIPLNPTSRSARSCDNSETNLCVLSASTRIEVFPGRGFWM